LRLPFLLRVESPQRLWQKALTDGQGNCAIVGAFALGASGPYGILAHKQLEGRRRRNVTYGI